MPRPKKKSEWPSPYALPQEQSASSPTASSEEKIVKCSECAYASVMSSEVWRVCGLKLPQHYKVIGPPVTHRDDYCSFFKPKG